MTASSPMPCDVGFYCPEGTKHQLPYNTSMCNVGSVAYNNTCYNLLTHGCPLNLDCTRRNAAGLAPCVEGYGMVGGVCVVNAAAAPFVLTPPMIVGIVCGVLVVGGITGYAVSSAVMVGSTKAVVTTAAAGPASLKFRPKDLGPTLHSV